MRIDAASAARIVSGTLVGGDGGVVADGIWFDTRSLTAGRAFVAIRAERDGHDHLGDALAAGAPFALVERGRAHPHLPCVEVDDTLAALAALGGHCRDRLSRSCGNRIVGITGSAGKTSTKQLIGAVLSAGFPGAVAATASLNNDIGVPVTLVCAPETTPAIVVELGMRGLGEITRLCAIARPMIGVVTNVGDAHSARVGGRDGVARAKTELAQSLPADGTAILNADDPRVSAMGGATRAAVVTYGSAVSAGVRSVIGAMGGATRAAVVTYGSAVSAGVRFAIESRDTIGRATARFTHEGSSATGLVPLVGDHMVANAAAAVAVGLVCGLKLGDAVGALATAEGVGGRGSWSTTGQVRILDDSYNANSGSMSAALSALAGSGTGKLFAVFGEMAEIDESERAHRAVAERATGLGVTVLAHATTLYGVPAMSLEEIVAVIRAAGPCSVLVKGSRSARTERVVAALMGS